MVIDSHIHFYAAPRPGSAYTDAKDHLTFPEVLSQARSIGISKIVQVTPAAIGYDNDHSFEVAERHPDDVLGVIVRLDPFSPDIDYALRAASERPQMLALRLTLIDPHNVTALADRTFDGFFERAQSLGVRIELFAPFRVPEMHETVRRFPGIQWLIDHMGLRYYAGRDNTTSFRQWDQLLQLAEEPNAWIKCSYFPEAAADLDAYPYPVAQRHLKQLVEQAGATRLVWGSNFPNVRRACTYRQALDFVRVECDFLSEPDRSALLGGNFLRYSGR